MEVFDANDAQFSRLRLFERFSEANLERLNDSRLALVGLGGLGSGFLNAAGRLPFAQLRLIDRDLVEPENLGHQLLFTGEDAERHRSKVEAAETHLTDVNPYTTVTPQLVDLTHENIEQMLDGSDLIVDGLDNFYTRYLINDYAVKHGLPWIYSGVVEEEAAAMAVIPGETACLRCWKPDPPELGETRTCDVYGVSPTAVSLVGSFMGQLAVELLTGDMENAGRLFNFDYSDWRLNSVEMERDPACPCCGEGEYEFLDGGMAPGEGKLCGSDAVQLRLDTDHLDLRALAERMDSLEVTRRPTFLTVNLDDGRRVTIFSDGRLLQTGDSELSSLRSFVDKYVGS